jgi:NAD-specific glutamate dehydrogenase
MKQSEIEAKVIKQDRQIEAIKKLIATGMKMIVRNDQQIARNDQQIARNAQAIAELTKNVNALVKYSERGQNGHRKNDPKAH